MIFLIFISLTEVKYKKRFIGPSNYIYIFNISLSIEHNVKLVNFFCDIVDLRHFFDNFNLEKFISAKLQSQV